MASVAPSGVAVIPLGRPEVYQVYGAWPPETVSVALGYGWSTGSGPGLPVLLMASDPPPEVLGGVGRRVVTLETEPVGLDAGFAGLAVEPVGEPAGLDAGFVRFAARPVGLIVALATAVCDGVCGTGPAKPVVPVTAAP
jgi:hypothetical protein